MNDSHASLRDLYNVSTPELDLLVNSAVSVSGCYGARLTGAGFGGCVIAIANLQSTDAVIDHVIEEYRTKCGREAVPIVSRPSAGARLVE
jgi:galactokinase